MFDNVERRKGKKIRETLSARARSRLKTSSMNFSLPILFRLFSLLPSTAVCVQKSYRNMNKKKLNEDGEEGKEETKSRRISELKRLWKSSKNSPVVELEVV